MSEIKKFCFYGPESTGKSVMARHLAKVYHTEYVSEVAREFVTSNNFTLEDIIKIGYAQIDRVNKKTKTANKVLFCDTDIITTQIYCRHYLGHVPDVLYPLEKMITYDQYFLFDIDVPWVPDGMRDLKERRPEMYQIFKDELVKRKISFITVKGIYEEREKLLRGWIDVNLAVDS